MEDRQGTLNGTDHPPPPHVGRPVRGTNPKVLDLWTVPHPVLANSMDAHYGATTWNELLWLRYWPLRPLLFIPGIVLALVGHFVLMCAHYDTDHDAVLWRVSFTEDWPLSWKLWKAMQGAT